MKPSFFIIGAMKSGTTSLFHYLNLHPDICMANTKETNFLLDSNFSRGASWYANLFDDKSLICGEASTNYSKRHLFPYVAKRLYELSPKGKLVYVLRDPVDRIVSQFVHNCAKGREKNTLFEIIRSAENKYIMTSRYYFQIQAYFPYFDDNQILLITAEDLKSNRAQVLKSTFSFLGAEPDFYSDRFELEHHLSSDKKAPAPASGERNHSQKGEIGSNAHTPVPDLPLIQRPRLNSNERNLLCDLLREDIGKLRAWSGIKFDQWSV